MRDARAPRRTDAVRNAERIVEAAVLQLRQRPDATMTSIARAAGVGRVTLYGHFASRRDLVDAAIVRELADAQHALDEMIGFDDAEWGQVPWCVIPLLPGVGGGQAVR